MAKKIKLSRKQIQKPDEFINWFDQALDYIQANSLQVVLAISAILVGVVAGQGLQHYRESKKDEAIQALTDATATLQAPLQKDLTDQQILAGAQGYPSADARNTEAISRLSKVSKDYPGTLQASRAQLFLAGAYFDNKNYREAVETYNGYFQANPALDPELKAVALMGLASSHYNLGNFKEALNAYRQIIEIKNALNRDEALIGAARCLQNLGDADQAVATLKQAEDEYPGTVATRGAAMQIRILEKAKTLTPPPKESSAKGADSFPSAAAKAPAPTEAPQPAAPPKPAPGESPPKEPAPK